MCKSRDWYEIKLNYGELTFELILLGKEGRLAACSQFHVPVSRVNLRVWVGLQHAYLQGSTQNNVICIKALPLYTSVLEALMSSISRLNPGRVCRPWLSGSRMHISTAFDNSLFCAMGSIVPCMTNHKFCFPRRNRQKLSPMSQRSFQTQTQRSRPTCPRENGRLALSAPKGLGVSSSRQSAYQWYSSFGLLICSPDHFRL